MGIHPSWYIEGHVLSVKLNGTLSEAQLAGFDKLMTAFLRAGTAPQVHLLIDVSELTALPPIMALSRMGFLRHHRHGWWMIIGGRSGSAIHSTLHLITDSYQIQYADKADESSALRFLAAVDPSVKTPAYSR